MKKKDVIIIAVILLLLSVSFLYRNIAKNHHAVSKDRVIIKYDNKEEIYEIKETPQIITIDQGAGIINEICISKDGIYMLKSTCKNQLCVRQPKMTPENIKNRIMGRYIVCLPHKLTIELETGEDNNK